MRDPRHGRSTGCAVVVVLVAMVGPGPDRAMAQGLRLAPTAYRVPVAQAAAPRAGFSYQAGYAANGTPGVPAAAVLGWGPGAWIGPGPGFASQGFGAWSGPAPAYGSGYPGYGFGSPGEGYRGGFPIGPPGDPAGLPGAGFGPRRPVPPRR